MKNLNRRKFLKLGAASLAMSGLSYMPRSFAAAQALNHSNEYKALVCVFLFGGNDGFNMLVPTNDSAYNVYANSRQNLAVAKESLLSISPLTTDGNTYGLHPQLAAMKNLFDNGSAAFVSNVGNLIQPVSKDEARSNPSSRPRQLFSHNNQQDQWQFANPDTLDSGWGARLASLYASAQGESLLTGLSVNNRSKWLTNTNFSGLAVKSSGFSGYNSINPASNNSTTVKRREAFLQLVNHQYNNPFSDNFSQLQQRTVSLVENVGATIDGLTPFTNVTPEGNNLASQLEMVAKVIASRETLGMQRQVFFVSMGGFDTHDDQLTRQPALYVQLSEALNSFNNQLTELGVNDKVTTFTQSEFGRTLTSNGDGTDHGWGNHQIVMGNAVRGGDIYGTMPDFAIGSDDDYRSGRIIPTTSIEQYASSMLNWFGLDSNQLASVLPNLNNFDANQINLMNV